MWLSDALKAAALTALLLGAGCTFTPVYGTGGAATQLQGQTTIVTPGTPNGYALLRDLERRLGPSGPGTYVLDITELETSGAQVAVGRDQGETRAQVIASARFTLTLPDGQKITDEVSAFSGYSLTGSTIATQTAEADANARAMAQLAQAIEAALLAALSQHS